MWMRINPFCLKVKGNEQSSGDAYEFYIGDPKKITRYMHREDINQLLIEVGGKYFEVEDPDIKAFLTVCRQFSSKKESLIKRINRWLRK